MRRLRAWLILTAGVAFGLPAHASPRSHRVWSAAQTALESETQRRDRVVVLVKGELGEEALGALTALLANEIDGKLGTLSLARTGAEVRDAIVNARREPAALLIAVLDARDANAWQLYVVDAARGRAIVRRLPGGLAGDAAAIEAVSAIVVSAAGALEEGLEVASQPIDAVVAPRGDVERSAGRTDEDPQPSPAPAPLDTPPPEPTTRPRESSVEFRGSVAALAASFDEHSTLTEGLALSLGLVLDGGVVLRLMGARHLPARLGSVYGDFTLDRSWAAASAGLALGLGELELAPELACLAELLERRDADPAPGVAASADESVLRIGVAPSLRVLYRLGEHAALESALGAAYFPRTVRFVSGGPDSQELAAPWPWMAFATLGMSISAP